MLVVAKVEKLFASLFANRQAVRSALELPPPGTDELALLIEDHHRVQALAARVDRVMNIDVTLRILADSMSVAVANRARQLAPVVERLVLVLAFSNDGRLVARFVRCAQEDRDGGSRCGRDHKTATCDFHWRALLIVRERMIFRHLARIYF